MSGVEEWKSFFPSSVRELFNGTRYFILITVGNFCIFFKVNKRLLLHPSLPSSLCALTIKSHSSLLQVLRVFSGSPFRENLLIKFHGKTRDHNQWQLFFIQNLRNHNRIKWFFRCTFQQLSQKHNTKYTNYLKHESFQFQRSASNVRNRLNNEKSFSLLYFFRLKKKKKKIKHRREM